MSPIFRNGAPTPNPPHSDRAGRNRTTRRRSRSRPRNHRDRTSANDSNEHGGSVANNSSSSSSSRSSPPVMGYYNSFHTHAKIAPYPPRLPTYETVSSGRGPYRFKPTPLDEANDKLPPYTCSVFMQGPLALKQELSSPFTVAYDRRWRNVHATLRGTQLQFYRSKNGPLFGKTYETPQAGRLLKTYSLQHAEVGVAQDFKKTEPIPRSTFAKMVPATSRAKLFETDPHLFDPPREFALRIRAEAEQFLLCVGSVQEMLDWIEALCAAVDISMPLDERSEPRYRTLPRRNRRGNQQNNAGSGSGSGNGEGSEGSSNTFTLRFDETGNPEANQRFVEEQERILQSLYRHTYTETHGNSNDAEGLRRAATPNGEDGDANADPDVEDLEHPEMFLTVPGDTRPGSRAGSSVGRASPSPLRSGRDRSASGISDASRNGDEGNNRGRTREDDEDASGTSRAGNTDELFHRSKPRSSRHVADPVRMRRRFAPNLHASSPRASDVVFIEGKRWKVHPETQTLHAWESKPPRYNDHGFNKKGGASTITLISSGANSGANEADHPTALSAAGSGVNFSPITNGQTIDGFSSSALVNESSEPSLDSGANAGGAAASSAVVSSNHTRPTPLIRINSHRSSDNASSSTTDDDDLAISVAPPTVSSNRSSTHILSQANLRTVVPNFSSPHSRSHTPDARRADPDVETPNRPSTVDGEKPHVSARSTAPSSKPQLQHKKSSGLDGLAAAFLKGKGREKGKQKEKEKEKMKEREKARGLNGGREAAARKRTGLSLYELV